MNKDSTKQSGSMAGLRVAQPQSVVNSVLKSIEGAQSAARDSMRQLDEEIESKAARHHQVVFRSVSVRQTASLIAQELRRFVDKEREALLSIASSAANLRSHASYRSPGAVIGDGSREFVSVERTALNVGSVFGSPSAALALLLDDEAIERFALSLAQASGAPETGPSVQHLADDANTLADELEALYEQKFTLDRGLAGLMDAKLSRLFSADTPDDSAETGGTED